MLTVAEYKVHGRWQLQAIMELVQGEKRCPVQHLQLSKSGGDKLPVARKKKTNKQKASMRHCDKTQEHLGTELGENAAQNGLEEEGSFLIEKAEMEDGLL